MHRALAPSLALLGLALLLGPAAAATGDGPGCIVRPWTEGGGSFRAVAPEARSASGPPALAPAAPTGSLHMLVLLAAFADIPPRAPLPRFQGLLFGSKPSVRDYYDEVSEGQLDVSGDLYGWVTLPHDELYYSQGLGGVSSYPNNGQRMAEDAVSAALSAYPALNLGSYDGDGDGNVDVLLVIHSGQGFEWAGTTGQNAVSSNPDPNAINSHKWVTVQRDFGSGARVTDYFTCPELQLVRAPTSWPDSVCTIGVYCHELGHMFGLPDYYDTQNLANHLSAWDIMDFGTWNRVPGTISFALPGALPGHFSAWSKMFLGWTQPDVVSPMVRGTVQESRTLTSASLGGKPLELLANPFGVDWAPGSPGTGEYFLAEVRTKDGYDAGLPAEGLLLYHVDESRSGNNASSNPDGGALLRVLPQDGKVELDQKPQLDPWPGAQTAFGPLSTPSSRLWNGSESGVSLPVIGTVSGASVSLSVTVTNLGKSAKPPYASPDPYGPSVHGTTELVFTSGSVTGATGVDIFDVTGRRVRTLGPVDLDTVTDIALWDGRGDDGRPVVSGVYLFRLKGGPHPEAGRIALVR